MTTAVTHVSTFFIPDNRLEQGPVEFPEFFLTQSDNFVNDGFRVPAELAYLDAPADIRPILHPSQAPAVDFDCSLIIPARDVKVHHRDLQNPAIELAHFPGFGIPGILQCFMGFEVFARVD